MLVSQNKRMEWNIPSEARVLQLCLLDYTTLARLRVNPELSPHERVALNLWLSALKVEWFMATTMIVPGANTGLKQCSVL
jgi:hypothetical protein